MIVSGVADDSIQANENHTRKYAKTIREEGCVASVT